MQLVIGQNDGTTTSIDLNKEQTQPLTGLRIGQEFDGSAVGLDGYTLQITGGSDLNGFPMKKQLKGTGRKRILAKGGTGVKNLEKGERRRKTLRGNTVSDEIVQLNCRVVEAGPDSIEELLSEDTAEEEPEEEEEEE